MFTELSVLKKHKGRGSLVSGLGWSSQIESGRRNKERKRTRWTSIRDLTIHGDCLAKVQEPDIKSCTIHLEHT